MSKKQAQELNPELADKSPPAAEKDWPLPETGGSYQRNPDTGELTEIKSKSEKI